MVMPKKYENESDKRLSAHAVRNLVKEIKDISGWTWERISAELNLKGHRDGCGISSDLLRQYAAGNKPASAKRQLMIAKAAAKCGIGGPQVMQALQHLEIEGAPILGMSKSEYSEWKKCVDKFNFYNQQVQRQAVLRVERALRALMSWGHTEVEMLYMVTALIEQMTPAGEGVGRAGMVEPERLPYCRESDKLIAPLRVSWQINRWESSEGRNLLLGEA